MCGYVACVPDCRGSLRNYDNPDLRSSLMMAGYCRNMYEPVYRIKEWYNQCILLVISTACNMHGTFN
jgi:hypothetical protein